MDVANNIWQIAFALLLVIGVVMGLGFAAKKTRLVKTGDGSALKVVDSAYLGPKERLLLVEVGNQQVLIGMSVQGIAALAQIVKPDGFADTLQRVHSDVDRQSAGNAAP